MGDQTLLVVDDEKLIRWSLHKKLTSWGYEVLQADSGASAVETLRRHTVDLVLLDLGLPDARGLEMVHLLREQWSETPLMVLTGDSSVDTAIEAVKEGVADYLVKPVDFQALAVRLERTLEACALRREVTLLRDRLRRDYTLERLIGDSPAMARPLSLARRVAARDATVLIQGESGTGKDCLARAIHGESERGGKPFVEITCTAMPHELLETELFGHEAGAFTDGKAKKLGLFEVADGGTVFLNEIGATDGNIQSKLLSVIEQKQFRPVGGTRVVRVDIRVIAATNRDLAQAVEAGEFREDLYYRLQVFPIHLPPLRERGRDVLLLANCFLDEFGRQTGRTLRGFSAAAEEKVLAYDWPGNVRELRNVVERAVILLDDGDYVPADLVPQNPESTTADAGAGQHPLVHLPPEGAPLQAIEREALAQALDRTAGNQAAAAKLLHLGRDALRYRMKKHGLLE